MKARNNIITAAVASAVTSSANLARIAAFKAKIITASRERIVNRQITGNRELKLILKGFRSVAAFKSQPTRYYPSEVEFDAQFNALNYADQQALRIVHTADTTYVALDTPEGRIRILAAVTNANQCKA